MNTLQIMSILTDYIVPVGILLTFAGTLISIYYTRKNSKSTKFIDTITSERIKWIEKLRLEVADLHSCFLIIITNHYAIIQIDDLAKEKNDPLAPFQAFRQSSELQNEISSFSRTDLVRKINTIRLRLNPTEDVEILTCLDDLLNFAIGNKRNQEIVSKIWDTNLKLLNLTQLMLKEEWEKVKKEAKS